MSIPPRGKGRRAAAQKPASKKPAPARPAATHPLDARASAPSSVAPHTAAILAIGDEVLRGEIANTNATFLSERLFDAGMDVCEQRVVADQGPAMRRALEELAQRAAVVVVTGGLGPTEDDRTVDVVADLLGVEAGPHSASLEAMKKRFAAHGFELTPNNLRQVRVPRGAEALPNEAGIAPGFLVRIAGHAVYFLPGIPREMERIYFDHVAPRLRAHLAAHGAPVAAVRTWHVYGMGESHIDHRLAKLLENIPHATLHFRTDAPENHVKVVIRGPDTGKNQELLEQVDRDLRKRIGPGIYGVDGETFPKVVGQTLRAAGTTLALAESCTGGEAGEMITAEPGASDFFVGSVVAYSNDVKVNVLGVKATTIAESGAVSEPCAKEMAEGARRMTGAAIAVSITGVAGPAKERDPSGSGTSEKPVGTVCFALAGAKSTKAVSKLFSGDRERIRRAAAYFALDLARRHSQ
jgi:nicotinamide-nucleotide amidase